MERKSGIGSRRCWRARTLTRQRVVGRVRAVRTTDARQTADRQCERRGDRRSGAKEHPQGGPTDTSSAGEGREEKWTPALRGNPWVRSTLTEAAGSASRKKESEFQNHCQAWKPRLGHSRAIVAVPQALAETALDVQSAGQPYAKPGANPMPGTKSARLIRHHTRLLKTLRKRLEPEPERRPLERTSR